MQTKIFRSLLSYSSLLVFSALIGCQFADSAQEESDQAGPQGGFTGHGSGGFPGAGMTGGSMPKDQGGAQPGLPGGTTGGLVPTGTSGAETQTGADTTGAQDTTGTEPKPECNDTDLVKLYLSPDDSNSLSSPSQLKQRLLGPTALDNIYSVPLRGWEFFNYYNFPYPEPQATLGAHLELRPAGDEPGHYRLQIGVKSKSWSYETRPAMNLTFVLDTSGSMNGPPIQMLKASVRAIASKLRAGDKVSIVTWSDSQAVLLDSHQVTVPGDPAILQVSDAITVGGGTDLDAGLRRGYTLAQKNYINDAINRVILVSDGGANLGVTSKELIGQNAMDAGKDGIYLAGVGVGTESTYYDGLMDSVTDAGKGASAFIYSQEEAQRIFGDQFLSTFGIAAKNVQVELNLPAGFELVNFSGEEASTDPTEVEPQHLGPNDSMVFYQEVKTCAPEKFDPNAMITVTVRYTDALTHQPNQLTVSSSFAQLTQAAAPALEKGTALTYFIDAMKATQEMSAEAMNLRTKALTQIDAQLAVTPGDQELVELKTMLTRVAQ